MQVGGGHALRRRPRRTLVCRCRAGLEDRLGGRLAKRPGGLELHKRLSVASGCQCVRIILLAVATCPIGAFASLAIWTGTWPLPFAARAWVPAVSFRHLDMPRKAPHQEVASGALHPENDLRPPPLPLRRARCLFRSAEPPQVDAGSQAEATICPCWLAPSSLVSR